MATTGVTAVKRAKQGSGENQSITILYASGKPIVRVSIETNALDGAAAQDQTDIGQCTITDILALAYYTPTTIS